jgi:hypothetical protein
VPRASPEPHRCPLHLAQRHRCVPSSMPPDAEMSRDVRKKSSRDKSLRHGIELIEKGTEWRTT